MRAGIVDEMNADLSERMETLAKRLDQAAAQAREPYNADEVLILLLKAASLKIEAIAEIRTMLEAAKAREKS